MAVQTYRSINGINLEVFLSFPVRLGYVHSAAIWQAEQTGVENPLTKYCLRKSHRVRVALTDSSCEFCVCGRLELVEINTCFASEGC